MKRITKIEQAVNQCERRLTPQTAWFRAVWEWFLAFERKVRNK